MLTRRELGKLALGVPAATILGRSESIFGAPSPIMKRWFKPGYARSVASGRPASARCQAAKSSMVT